MSVRHLIWAWILALLTPLPASACITLSPFELGDIRGADAIVVGSVKRYEIVDYDDDYGRLAQYALLTVDVKRSIKGEFSGPVLLIWPESNFGFSDNLLVADPALIAIDKEHDNIDIPKGGIFPIKRHLPRLLDSPCSSPFILPASPEMEKAVRAILADRSMKLSGEETDALRWNHADSFRSIAAIHRRESRFGVLDAAVAAVLVSIIAATVLLWRRKRRRTRQS